MKASGRKKRRYRRRKCLHCRNWFMPAPNNAWHQKFCGRKACRLISRRKSYWKWRRNNPAANCGRDEVLRVQLWRKEHPKYWRSAPRYCILTDVVLPLGKGKNRRILVRIRNKKHGALHNFYVPQSAGSKALAAKLAAALHNFVNLALRFGYACPPSKKKRPRRKKARADGRKTRRCRAGKT